MKKSTVYVLILNFYLYVPSLAENGETQSQFSSTLSVSRNITSGSDSEEKITHIHHEPVGVGDIEPSVDVNVNLNEHDSVDSFSQSLFAEAASQNAGISNDLNTGGTPTIVSLEDVALNELKQKADIPSIDSSQEEIIQKNITEGVPEIPTVIETRTLENKSNTTEPLTDKQVPSDASQNHTVQTEDIPSFSEWAQKRLEEAEKKEQLNVSGPNQSTNGKARIRWKNYASPNCGAKVVAANPEAGSPEALLSPSKDEYKLNTCTSRIWFIVELCEAIQAKKIEMANFELFSSSPKDFVVSIADRFPSREWSIIGQFTAKDERDIQSFQLDHLIFGKYIKVEIKSHYGSEHFCPISLFRVYGTSEIEVLQKEELVRIGRVEDEDDEDYESVDLDNDGSIKNILHSATDAVFSLFKKAAEVLVNTGNSTNQTITQNITNSAQYSPLINTCSTPSHLIVCDNCSDILFGQVYELLSCKSVQIESLVRVPFVHHSLIHSNMCQDFGLTLNNRDQTHCLNTRSDFVQSLFPKRILGAMCNNVAISESKVVLNVSLQYSNATKTTVKDDKIVDIESTETFMKPEEVVPLTPDVKNVTHPSELNLEVNQVDSPKASCSTDILYTSQIKPTKTTSTDIHLEPSNLLSDMEVKDHVNVNSEINSLPIDSVKTEDMKSPPSISELPINGVGSNNVKSVSESTETIDEQLEQLMTDLNGDATHSPSSVAATPATHGSKETVFLRLSNRLKALEQNMSLSSQYLEELSKRYKKQVEEMQKLLDKALQNWKEESRKSEEITRHLEDRLNNFIMLVERNNSTTFIYWAFFIIAIIIGFCSFCWRTADQFRTEKSKTVEIQRRKSVDVVSYKKPVKTRRPSDQALKIVRSSLLAEETRIPKERKKKNKKKVLTVRSNSISTLPEETQNVPIHFHPQLSSSKVWIRQESTPPEVQIDWFDEANKNIEHVNLDESDHSSLEPLSTILSISEKSPQIFKMATENRTQRMSSQNGPLNINGNTLMVELPRKSVSLDESQRSKSPSLSLNTPSSVNSSISGKTARKEKKGFKNMLKKVFN